MFAYSDTRANTFFRLGANARNIRARPGAQYLYDGNIAEVALSAGLSSTQFRSTSCLWSDVPGFIVGVLSAES